jgi:hypothetical protein
LNVFPTVLSHAFSGSRKSGPTASRDLTIFVSLDGRHRLVSRHRRTTLLTAGCYVFGVVPSRMSRMWCVERDHGGDQIVQGLEKRKRLTWLCRFDGWERE